MAMFQREPPQWGRQMLVGLAKNAILGQYLSIGSMTAGRVTMVHRAVYLIDCHASVNLVMPPPINIAFVCPSVRLSVHSTVTYIANNSRTQRPSVPYQFQAQKLKVTRPINADTRRAPYLPNGKAYELQTCYTDGR